MPNVTEVDEQGQVLQSLFENFMEAHTKSLEGNKAAAGRARKNLGEIKKLVTDYRKVSVEMGK